MAIYKGTEFITSLDSKGRTVVSVFVENPDGTVKIEVFDSIEEAKAWLDKNVK
jgi:hypothetical protein